MQIFCVRVVAILIMPSVALTCRYLQLNKANLRVLEHSDKSGVAGCGRNNKANQDLVMNTERGTNLTK